MVSISGPDFITLIVSDLAVSRAFYRDKVGFRESEARPNALAFVAHPCGLAIRQSPDGRKIESPGQGVTIWLRSSDASADYRELKQRGVQIVEPLREGPFGMTFSFGDPDGYILTVHDGG